MTIVLILASCELGARIFWRVKYGLSMTKPGNVLYAFYPELQAADTGQATHGDEYFDILILGGSVLNRNLGQVEQDLEEELAFAGHRHIRIFNLAVAAHTSRDSWLKYASIRNARFDLVMFYHAINEARANNVPAGLFREDYGHYSWYESVNAMALYHGNASFALPYTLKFLGIRLRQRINRDSYLPTHEPSEDWVQYGSNVKTAPSFRRNLNAVVDLAARRGDPVLLMTFATYFSPGYSHSLFMEKKLDYGLHSIPIKVWGKPDDLRRTVAIHNDVARAVAAAHPQIMFVDQAKLMGDTPRYYNDVCHLTVAGSTKFVANILPPILSLLVGNVEQ